MNYIETLESLIYEKKVILAQSRATGRTNRIVNKTVEDLFNEPIGTKIAVRDHYWGENVGKVGDKGVVDDSHHKIGSMAMRDSSKQADMALLKMIKRRLDNEYPNVKVSYDIMCYPYTIVRNTPTLKEQYEKEIADLEEKLAKIKK